MNTTTQKKQKVYKIAAELNLSSQVILDFLEKKGIEVKSHMSAIEPDVVSDIMTSFKKDKDLADRHQRKVEELRKTQRKKDEERELKTTTEETPKRKTESDQTEKESPLKEVKEDAEPMVVTPIEEKSLPKEADKTKEKQPDDIQKERKPLPGLKIKGKIELERKRERGEKVQPSDEAAPVKKKRKKKKKVREEARTVVTRKRSDGITPKETEKKKRRKKKPKSQQIDETELQQTIKKTLAAMDDTGHDLRSLARRKRKRERIEEEKRILEEREKGKSILKVIEYITVGELADSMDVPSNEVIAKCIELGLMVSINQRMDADLIVLLAGEFGFEVEFEEEFAGEIIEEVTDYDDVEKLQRAPIVTIMGHVDHGKTTLLDFIRKTNVVAGEAGGITQHIGAYEVTLDNEKTIAFLDTPGHEAFTAMRARGAQITDIVVLVVAADDNVMPQTIEAINHAQAAGVPIIVAINKVDKPGANIDRVKQQLSERNVLIEEWGGKYQSVEISAKFGKNIDQLMEKILLEAEILNLKSPYDSPARGVVIEGKLDRGKGIVTTVLVEEGTLRIGDPFLTGLYSGKVRAMFDERENRIDSAPPSKPVQVTGFDGMPKVGDRFIVMESETLAREISNKRRQLKREQELRHVRHITLDDISRNIQRGEKQDLPVIVKADVDGSVEALSESLTKLSNDEVNVKVIHKGVGAINDADVLLAAASEAIIVGFQVRPLTSSRKIAETEKVEIRLYSVIYDAISDVKSALEGLLSPEIKEEVVGTAEVRETFKTPKAGTVAGCHVQEGKIARNNKVRLVRDGIVIYNGAIGSLKRFKDDVREVDSGYECGIGIENFNDIKIGDIIESYRLIETKRTLE